MKKLAISVLFLTLAGFSSNAIANQTVDISITITPGCQIDPISPINLGNFQFINTITTISRGSFNIRCQTGQIFSWTFDNGAGNVNLDAVSSRRFMRKRVAPGIYQEGPKVGFEILSNELSRVVTAPNSGNNLSAPIIGNGTFSTQFFDVRVRPQDQLPGWHATPGTYTARLNLVIVF